MNLSLSHRQSKRFFFILILILVVFCPIFNRSLENIVLAKENNEGEKNERLPLFSQLRHAFSFDAVLIPIAKKSPRGSWDQIKGKHFVVYYTQGTPRDFAHKVSQKAEYFYQKVGAQIGYTRYVRFWTWEERVKIIIFPDKNSFMQKTGQPAWSIGYADRDSHLFQSKTIITYQQEHDFFDGLLPHEISHLILHDFISSKSIPVWFDEGIAQLYEKDKSAIAHQLMSNLMKRNQYIHFHVLTAWDIRKEKDVQKAKIFYAQSVSVVEFLLKRYGVQAFQRLCRNLRDEENFNDALKKAYTNNIKSIADLEKKWVQYIMR